MRRPMLILRRTLLLPMLLAAPGCVQSPPISAPPPACSSLIPDDWAAGVKHAPAPVDVSDALGGLKGLYAFCPFILGRWPDERYPSSLEYADLLSDVKSNRARVAYGIDAFAARDPLAWPGFATVADVAGLAPTVVSVNELDPLCDEGVAFYRLLASAGVEARGRVVLGTTHAVEQFPTVWPELSRAAAADLARVAKGA